MDKIMNNIIKQSKEALSQVTQIISMQYQKMVKAYQLEQQAAMEQQRKQNVQLNQMYLQDALFHILQSMNVHPNLTAITSNKNLIPCKLQNMSSNVCSFEWTKKTYETICLNDLKQVTDQINTTILMEHKRLCYVYQSSDAMRQTYLLQNYYALFKGFRVIDIKDMGIYVKVSVVYCHIK